MSRGVGGDVEDGLGDVLDVRRLRPAVGRQPGQRLARSLGSAVGDRAYRRRLERSSAQGVDDFGDFEMVLGQLAGSRLDMHVVSVLAHDVAQADDAGGLRRRRRTSRSPPEPCPRRLAALAGHGLPGDVLARLDDDVGELLWDR